MAKEAARYEPFTKPTVRALCSGSEAATVRAIRAGDTRPVPRPIIATPGAKRGLAVEKAVIEAPIADRVPAAATHCQFEKTLRTPPNSNEDAKPAKFITTRIFAMEEGVAMPTSRRRKGV
jgi:hypothetical protein